MLKRQEAKLRTPVSSGMKYPPLGLTVGAIVNTS